MQTLTSCLAVVPVTVKVHLPQRNMYEDPNFYSEHSEDHQREARRFLEKTIHLIEWGENELVLDIGCGSGDVTHNVLLDFVPNTFSQLVAVDYSKEMISFAKNRWGNPKLSFEVLDISESDKKKLVSALPITAHNGFHKIFSFFCLQWVHDLRQVAENIKFLLRPGGQALLLLVVRNGTYVVWDSIARSENWSKYFRDKTIPMNPYQYMSHPEEVLRSAMEDAGLVVHQCSLQSHKNVFTAKTDDDNAKIDRLRSVDPLIRDVPVELRNVYMQEILTITKEMISNKGATDYDSVTILLNRPK